jgi:DNA helicase MCM9
MIPYDPRSSLELLSAMPKIVNFIFSRPRTILPLLDAAAVSAQERVFSSSTFLETHARGEFEIENRGHTGSIKRMVRVRIDFYRLSCPGVSPTVNHIRTRHTGRLLTLHGTVTRLGTVKSHEVEQLMECTSCRLRFLVTCNKDVTKPTELPSICPSAGDQQTARCKNNSFRVARAGRPVVSDYQELYLQDPVCRTQSTFGSSWTLAQHYASFGANKYDFFRNTTKPKTSISIATTPHALLVVLEDDLVDKCKAGDDICVTLVVQWRWHRAVRDQRAQLEQIGHATSVQVLNKQHFSLAGASDDELASINSFWDAFNGSRVSNAVKKDLHRIPLRPLHGRNIILKSVCPQLHGLKTVKLAFLLALLGGVPRSEPDGGATIRGDSHLLIVGDPGMGKSQLLRYAAQVAPRSVLTSGVGSTAAGLTAAAVKSNGSERWMLDAGALVLADGGLCCIDEFDTISTGERAAIHEAMEQQTLSFAKGSIVATLQTRCSVLGATNPRGMKFDPNESLTLNTGLAPPLLSRFDCVFILQDDKDPDQDRLMSAHVLASYCAESRVASSACTTTMTVQANVFPVDNARFGKKRKKPASDVKRGTLHFLETVKIAQDERDQDCCAPEDEVMKWPFDRLRRYILLARCAVKPKLTPEAEALIRGYFQLRRQEEEDPKRRPTIRLIESLIRLTQAHARLMWMEEALPRDVIVAIELIESSTLDGARIEPDERDPEEYYRNKERLLIKRISKCE